MPKYRSKPFEVEATQYFPDGPPVVGVYPNTQYSVTSGVDPLGKPYHDSETIVFPAVKTMHGDVIRVEAGDWIITEPDGLHHYPCKPDVFADKYEAV